MAERAPGIIVRTTNSAGIIVPPIYERYPVYIGQGDPYRLIEDQRIVRSAGAVDNLFPTTDIDEISSVGDLPGISKYINGVDYALFGTDKISWLPGGSGPSLGNNYYITFTENRPASAFVPMLYFNENLIYADHGNKARADGTINSLAVASSIGMRAGAKGVFVADLDLRSAVDPNNPTSAELEAAFTAMRDELDKITGYKLHLVPLSSGTLQTTSAANLFFNHAVLASQPENKQERAVWACLSEGYTREQAVAFAQAYAHERMVVPFCYEGYSQPVGYGFADWYDTRYYVAGLAGLYCSGAIGANWADTVVPNVLVRDNFTPEEINWMLRRGVGVANIRGEVVRNIFQGTTDVTNALTEDLGVQDVEDYVKKYWREGLWAVYKNKKINERLIGQVIASSEGIMEQLTADEIISDSRNISVVQSGTEPRKLICTAEVVPAFTFTWADITFTFNLSFS